MTGKITSLLRMALLALAAALAVALSGTASAATTPTHIYSYDCIHDAGTWSGQFIAVQPQEIRQEASTLGVIGGDNHSGTSQYVYIWLWAYSFKYGLWLHSGPNSQTPLAWTDAKRYSGGYPGSWAEFWNSDRGAWMISNGPGANGGFLPISPDQIAIRVPKGSGQWYFEVETYWTPPFTNAPDPRVPTAPGGGLNVYDNDGYCTF
jgi:hypothetical protein